jgi:hypothetical protein
MKNILATAITILTPIWVIAAFAFGAVQIYAGYLGITLHWGSGWAVGIIIAALLFRITLPITVGAFLCATSVWAWHWGWAILFAAPGLLFMVPFFLASLLQAGSGFRRA